MQHGKLSISKLDDLTRQLLKMGLQQGGFRLLCGIGYGLTEGGGNPQKGVRNFSFTERFVDSMHELLVCVCMYVLMISLLSESVQVVSL